MSLPSTGGEARAIIERSTGRPIPELFAEFDDKPVASASIAQVHKAILRSNQRKVAIKVRRPNIIGTIESDVIILHHIAQFAEKHIPELAIYNPVGVVDEVAKHLQEEVDFTFEADNMRQFAQQFAGNHHLKVPEVFDEACTDEVLTMEFLKGYAVDDPALLEKHGIDTSVLAERMSKMVFQMIFEFGFFHGDPHPGNMSVLPDGTLALYDFGMMGRMTPSFRENVALAIMGLVNKDCRRLAQSLLGMSIEGHVQDVVVLENDLAAYTERYLDRPLNEINLEETMNQLLGILRTHKLRMKKDFYMGIKALTQVEATARLLSPDLNYIRLGKPFAMSVIESKFDFEKMSKGFFWGVVDMIDLIREWPLELRNLLSKLKRGEFFIPMRHSIDPQGFEPLRKTLDMIANRLAITIVTSAVLICGAIVVLAKVPPLWHGVSVPGVLGIVFGLILALRLLLAIWKRGGF
ncbi:AarF/UbiB family protein [Kamptonema cortianum]|nr:AarF/UbiB family protein [Kamptonema cortianum]